MRASPAPLATPPAGATSMRTAAADAGGVAPPVAGATGRVHSRLGDFVPELVVRHMAHRLAQPTSSATPFTAPDFDRFTSVVLFADLKGFTVLSESLSLRSGGLGAEHLGFWLNRYFELLVKLVQKAGGDVFKFVGDALVAVWPPEADDAPGGGGGGQPSGVERMMRRAIQCGLQIQSELHDVKFARGIRFSIKIGIGVGSTNIIYVGGVLNRMECFVTGESLLQALACESECVAGDVVVSAPVWSVVRRCFAGTTLKSKRVVVKKTVTPLPARHLQRTAPAVVLQSRLRELLVTFVPAAIVPHLSSELHAWSSELRSITVLFIDLGMQSVPLASATTAVLHRMQQVMTLVQQSVYKYEGSLNKFLVDDKGSTVLAVLGLPPLAHEDDPERGVLTALHLARALRAEGLECFIGVTSGVAFCGPVGSGSRREYSVLGDMVNTGSRLMQLASALPLASNATFTGCVLTDRATKQSAESNPSLVFEPFERRALKGKTEEVEVWQPGQLPEATIPISVLWQPEAPPVVSGFSGLHTGLITKVSSMLSGDYIPGVVVVAGDTGSGKTQLMKHVAAVLQSEYGAAIAVPMPVENGDVDAVLGNPDLAHYFAHVNSVFADSYVLPSVPEPGAAGAQSPASATTPAAAAAAASPRTAALLSHNPMATPPSAMPRRLRATTPHTDGGAPAATPPAGPAPATATATTTAATPSGTVPASTPSPLLRAATASASVLSRDDTLLRSLLKPTPSPRATPPRFDSGMTRPRSFRFKGSASSLVLDTSPTSPAVTPSTATARPALRPRSPHTPVGRSPLGVPPVSVAGSTPGDLSLDGLGIKYPLRVLYATGEVFKDTTRCFMWRQVVHQLTADVLYCFNQPDLPEVLKIIALIRGRRLFAHDTPDACTRFEIPILLRLLVLHASCVPVVLLLDECHHAGDRDWDMIDAVADMLAGQEALKCLAVLGTRPLHQDKHRPNFRPTSPAYYRVLSKLTTEYWQLSTMPRTDTVQIMKRELGVARVPPAFARLVHNMSGGNPLLTKKFLQALLSVELITLSLIDTDTITTNGVGVAMASATPLPSSARLMSAAQEGRPPKPCAADAGTVDNDNADDADDNASRSSGPGRAPTAVLHVHLGTTMFLPVPYKVQRIFARDLNRLGAEATLTLKAASVLCVGGGQTHTEFDMNFLAAVFPNDRGHAVTPHELEALLDTLIQFGFIRTPFRFQDVRTDATRADWRHFRLMSGLLRDVVYHRMLHAQRRRLHRAAANLLEMMDAGTFTGGVQFSSRRETHKHLYRHLELSGQRHKAVEVFERYFSGAAAGHRAASAPTTGGAEAPGAGAGAGVGGGACADASHPPPAFHLLSPSSSHGVPDDRPKPRRSGLMMPVAGSGSHAYDTCRRTSAGSLPRGTAAGATDRTTAAASGSGDAFVTKVLASSPSGTRLGRSVSSVSSVMSLYGGDDDDDDALPTGTGRDKAASDGGPTTGPPTTTAGCLAGVRAVLSALRGRRRARVAAETAAVSHAKHTDAAADAPRQPVPGSLSATSAELAPSHAQRASSQSTATPTPHAVPALPLHRVEELRDKEIRRKTSQGILRRPLVHVGSFRARPSRQSMPSLSASDMLMGRPPSQASNAPPPRAHSGVAARGRKSSMPVAMESATSMGGRGRKGSMPAAMSSTASSAEMHHLRSARSHEEDTVNLSARRRTSFLQHLSHHYNRGASPGSPTSCGKPSSPTESVRRSWVPSQTNLRRRPSADDARRRSMPAPVRRAGSDSSLMLGGGSPAHDSPAVATPFAPYHHMHTEVLVRCMRLVDSWGFDVFMVDQIVENAALLHVAKLVFHKRALDARLMLPPGALLRFAVAVQDGYSLDNPFTNSTHAADVLQCTHLLLCAQPLAASLTATHELAVLVAAMIHDYQHPAVTARHVVATRHPITATHGSDAPLERYHVAQAWQLLSDPSRDCNFTFMWTSDVLQQFKQLVLSIVLATAPDRHFPFLSEVAALSRRPPSGDDDVGSRQLLTLQLMMKAADVSHCARPFVVSKQWAHRMLAEFYQQGDAERDAGRPVSLFMDRGQPAMAQCQTTFMTYMAAPVLSVVGRLAPTFRDLYSAGLVENQQFWRHELRQSDDCGAAVWLPHHDGGADDDGDPPHQRLRVCVQPSTVKGEAGTLLTAEQVLGTAAAPAGVVAAARVQLCALFE